MIDREAYISYRAEVEEYDSDGELDENEEIFEAVPVEMTNAVLQEEEQTRRAIETSKAEQADVESTEEAILAVSQCRRPT